MCDYRRYAPRRFGGNFAEMSDQGEFNPENWKELTLTYRGKRVRGNYKVVGTLVTVVWGSDSKAANLGILPAERLAHMLLREIAFEKQSKSPLVAMARILDDR